MKYYKLLAAATIIVVGAAMPALAQDKAGLNHL